MHQKSVRKMDVNDEFNSKSNLFEYDNNICDSSTSLDKPRVVSVVKDMAPSINYQDMDSAMMSMLAMNQGGGAQ